MVDTQQLQLVSPISRAVSAIAGRLAEHSNLVTPLQIVTYFPIDVDSVSRILEKLQDEYGIERIERANICYFNIPEPSLLIEDEIELDSTQELWSIEGLKEQLDELKADEDWARKVREQHEVLAIAARAETRVIDLAYFLSRADIPSAKIQSTLNDFEAEGYIEHQFEEEDDSLEYKMPEFNYPEERYQQNQSVFQQLDGTERAYKIWMIIGACVLILLVVIILVQL